MAISELLTEAANLAEKHHESELHSKLMAARKKYFPIKSKENMEDIMQRVESAVDQFHYPNSLYETRTLCRCFLSSIFSMIRAAYGVAEIREYMAINVLARSIAEHIIDLRYIALKNDRRMNRRFTNYYKLSRYWYRDFIQYRKNDLPRIESEYRDYVLSDFQDAVVDAAFLPLVSNAGWKQIDKCIKDRYWRGWSGLSSTARIREIEDMRSLPMFQEIVPRWFNYMSSYTHPTSYSIPHFNLENQSFSVAYDKSRAPLIDPEEFLYLAIDLTIESFCISLEEAESKVINDLFRRLVVKARGLN